MSIDFLQSLPPLFVLVLTIFNYYTFVITFCLVHLAICCWKRMLVYLIIYHVLLIMFIISLGRTIFATHPAVPTEYRLRVSEHEKLQSFDQRQVDDILKRLIHLRQLDINVQTENGKVRYCNRCHQLKPDRTHHCSTCKRCILRMDHHCPWLGNCVGWINYKFFVLTLFYGSLNNILYLMAMAEIIYHFFSTRMDQDATTNNSNSEAGDNNNANAVQICVGYVLTIFTFIVLFSLFSYHLNLIYRNETTLENMQEIYFIQPNSTYNLGCKRNFREIFGDNFFFWFLPVRHGISGNGYEFPVKLS